MKSLALPLPQLKTRRLSDFWALTKPGVMGAVVLTALFGFLLGSPEGPVRWTLLINTLLGTALAAAGAGILNMLLEQEVDDLMERTKNRPIPAGHVASHEAFLLGGLCAGLGVVHLCLAVGMRSGFLAAMTLVLYLVFYTPSKTSTTYCSIVGSVSGALPPLIGFSAAAGTLTPAAWVLFAILFLWQFPHLLALSWIYRKDYENAGLKMLPSPGPKGERTGKIALACAVLLFIASLLPWPAGLTGPFYLVPAVLLSSYLLFRAERFAFQLNDASARKLFLASVVYTPLLLAAMVIW